MVCTSNSKKVAGTATGTGISRLVSQRAFQVGVASAAITSGIGMVLGLAALQKRRKQQERDVFSTRHDGAVFNQKVGGKLTEQFGGAEISENTMKAVVGPGSKVVVLDAETCPKPWSGCISWLLRW